VNYIIQSLMFTCSYVILFPYLKFPYSFHMLSDDIMLTKHKETLLI